LVYLSKPKLLDIYIASMAVEAIRHQ